MSIKVMNLVWESTLEGSSKRFVLLALADRASDQGECSALGVPTLCRKTGIKRSTMFGLLRDLEADGLIQRDEQTRTNGSRKASRFWINLPLLRSMERGGDDDRDADEVANPFGISAAQTPVQYLDGGGPDSGRAPVQDPDGPGVQILDGPRPDLGPLDPSSVSDTDPDGRRAPADAEAQAVRIVAALDLRKCGPSPRQLGQIRVAVAGAIERGVPAAVVGAYAHRKAHEAETVKYLVKAFTEEHLSVSTPPATVLGVPPVCGQCDAREGDPISARVEWLDDQRTRARRCPRCHPNPERG